MSLIDMILGRPLASDEAGEQRIGPVTGVPTFGLDALSSAAYGPEAALTVLLPLGAAGLSFHPSDHRRDRHSARPRLFQLPSDYCGISERWRFLHGHPRKSWYKRQFGGRCGPDDGLCAECRGWNLGWYRRIDLAVPGLQPYTLPLCLAILTLLTLVNLRGIAAAGSLFMLPTCVFVLSLGVILSWGMLAAISSGGHPQPVIAPPHLAKATEAVGAWVLLRAFASGCTAMTGVEAVSNGVQAFREPVVPAARRTLTAIIVILVVLLLGIAYLAHAYNVGRPYREHHITKAF